MSDIEPFSETLSTQLEKAKQLVKTDDYAMSIGELINLYKDGDLVLNPAFQRAFRWEKEKKTKLIESILMGIPVPEIFVSQKKDGTWNVVDGVQRLSTIFQLIGILEGFDPLKLSTCKYLPALMDRGWVEFPASLQRQFKRSRIRVNIIMVEGNEYAQYELFQRLNTGGSPLSEQEVRNCLMIMVNENFYQRVNELKKYKNFKSCLKLKDDLFSEEYHMELILRMYIGYDANTDFKKYEPLNSYLLSGFIDEETLRLCSIGTFDEFEKDFKQTFDVLKQVLGSKSFLKYDEDRDDFIGAFNVSAFEMISAGVSSNISSISSLESKELIGKIKSFYKKDEVKKLLKRGVKAIPRFKGLTEYSRNFFGG